MAQEDGVANAFDFPGFVPAYIRPLFCRGIGPFRWVALSGDPEDIYRTDAKVKELIPDDPHLHNWLDMASERIKFQGLPARICWVGLGDRARLGLAFNEMVAKGELKAPIVIGRDHLDSGSVASPNRETEGDEGRLGRGLRLAAAERAAQHRVGRDLGQPASRRRRRHGLLAACRHGDRAATARRRRRKRIERVLTNDPGTGVMRHADAGYDIAIDCAREQGLKLPMSTAEMALGPSPHRLPRRHHGGARAMARSRMPPSPSRAIASPGSARAPTCRKQAAKETVSLDGRWVTPGLIDCHTHLVFGGERAGEFEQRLKGATYEEIAKAGGGIVSTVRATRAASEAELLGIARSSGWRRCSRRA